MFEHNLSSGHQLALGPAVSLEFVENNDYERHALFSSSLNRTQFSLIPRAQVRSSTAKVLAIEKDMLIDWQLNLGFQRDDPVKALVCRY